MVDVPGDRRTHRVRQLRGCLALCVAVLLAITPLAHLALAVAPQLALAASAPSYASGGDVLHRGEEPALGLQGERPNAGILPRLLHLEGALPPPPQKPALARVHASLDLASKPKREGRPDGGTGTGLQRSSVGTARAPTGPPA
jgi:hypothetical protein